MGQIWFQNRSLEFEVVRLDRFCCPIALTIALSAPCFCHSCFGHYMRLPIGRFEYPTYVAI